MRFTLQTVEAQRARLEHQHQAFIFQDDQPCDNCDTESGAALVLRPRLKGFTQLTRVYVCAQCIEPEDQRP